MPINFFFYLLTIGYITHLLLWDSGFIRPSNSTTIKISTQDLRLINYLDYIRLLFCNYSKEKEYPHYHVFESNGSQLFSCPYCLAFWVNIILLVPFMYTYQVDWELFPLLFLSLPYVIGIIEEYNSDVG